MPNRREFLRMLALSLPATSFDWDKLLWVPGEKKIFIPSPALSLQEIVEIELMHLLPYVQNAFEKDISLWKALEKAEGREIVVMPRQIGIPVTKKVIT